MRCGCADVCTRADKPISPNVNRRAFLLAPFALFGAVQARGARVDVPQFGAFTERPKSGRVDCIVQFMPRGEVREQCRRLNQWPPGSIGPRACTSARLTDTPYIYVPEPESWDDLETMVELGHEVLHQLGAEHR